MEKEISRTSELPSTTYQPTTEKKRTWLYVGVILIVIVVIAAVAAIVLSPSFLPQSKITQVQIKVEYSGSWQGAYGDQTGISSWSGQGSKTITLNRPSQAETVWIISANAQKLDGSTDILRIMITKTDGTILKEGGTPAAYGVAQIAYTIQG